MGTSTESRATAGEPWAGESSLREPGGSHPLDGERRPRARAHYRLPLRRRFSRGGSSRVRAPRIRSASIVLEATQVARSARSIGVRDARARPEGSERRARVPRGASREGARWGRLRYSVPSSSTSAASRQARGRPPEEDVVEEAGRIADAGPSVAVRIAAMEEEPRALVRDVVLVAVRDHVGLAMIAIQENKPRGVQRTPCRDVAIPVEIGGCKEQRRGVLFPPSARGSPKDAAPRFLQIVIFSALTAMSARPSPSKSEGSSTRMAPAMGVLTK